MHETQESEDSKDFRVRILWVDDGQIYLGGHCQALTAAGMHLEITTSPHEAMRRLENARFDVVVADQDIPELTGIDLLAWAEKQHDHVLRYLVGGPKTAAAIQDMAGKTVQHFFERSAGAERLIHSIKSELVD